MEKLKIGLALGAGGARGMCHIGVLKALSENGIEPDIVTGSSMGAVIGGSYAFGMDLDELTALARSANNRLIRDFRLKKRWLGLFGGLRVEKLFDRHIGQIDIRDCKISFACTAVEVETGKLKVFTSGPLWHAIRASMSIPIIFQPVEIDGKLYIDGGVLCRVPIPQARDMGADFVIAVDALGPLPKDVHPKNIVEMTIRWNDIIDWELSKRKVGNADVLLTPETDRSILDFKKVGDVIDAGYNCAMQNMDCIKETLKEARKAMREAEKTK